MGRWRPRSLSKASGGQPVKLFLDRDTELMIAGNRPSVFAKIKIAGKKDGTITAWQSESWATGGIGGGGSPPIPYVFTYSQPAHEPHGGFDQRGGARAWRAPNHPQACYLTCSAIEDLAAKINMDPLACIRKEPRLDTRAPMFTAPSSRRPPS